MKHRVLRLSLLCVTLVLLSFRGRVREHMTGRAVPDFKLKNVSAEYVSLSSFPDAKGFIIVFTCNHCPFAKLYTARLNALSNKYGKQGVPLLAVNPMDAAIHAEETLPKMKERAKEAHYNFLYLQDSKQDVSRKFHASHTPEAFVVWNEQGKWIVRYSGAIDNNGQHPELATPYLANAVDELLQGKKVSHEETESIGCEIQYAR
ncbi:thioredoxin family protein [Chitinophagaceae bacterium MMS25-I14]